MVKFFKFRNIITIILVILLLIITTTLIDISRQYNKLKAYNNQLVIQNKNLIPYKLQIDSIRVIEQNILKLKPTAKNAKRLSQAIYIYSDEYNINPNVLISIARIQSNFQQYVISNSNCIGYFQLNANVHKLNYEYIYDQFYQTNKACWIFSQFRKIAHNDLIKSLNLYNGSLNNNYGSLVMRYYSSLT